MSDATSGKSAIEAAQERWQRQELADSLGRMPEREAQFTTVSGQPVERLYTPDADAAEKYPASLGFPGQYPYTRGIQPTMYRAKLWTMRQYAGFSSAEDSNARYRYLLDQGSTGLSVAFDLPTQIGYDSDHPLAAGEVGKVGVAIDTLDDVETLFRNIPLDRVSTSMTINATGPILLAMYVAAARKQGVAADRINGTIQNDILKEYIARGTYRFPPKPSLRLISDVFAWCAKTAPRWNTISVSGYHIREAGSTAAQEIAFTLADGIAYIEAAIQAGLQVDQFAPRLAFFFACHTDFFEEIAKFRAARRLYARLMRERFDAKDPRSMMLRFHTQTGGVTLTAQQPDNNVVRVTLQALAAVLGGTQSLHTNSRDEALGLPTEQSVRLALRTQQIIAHESGVAGTVDPIGGSYFVEKLTDDLEAEAERIIQQIDGMGGMVRAIEQGWVQRQIEQSAYELGQAIDAGQRVIVGVNQYADESEPDIPIFKVSEAAAGRQIQRLKEVRARRNPAQVQSALDAVARTAATNENLMPAILDAVEAYASIGEICTALQTVFGEYAPSAG